MDGGFRVGQEGASGCGYCNINVGTRTQADLTRDLFGRGIDDIERICYDGVHPFSIDVKLGLDFHEDSPYVAALDGSAELHVNTDNGCAIWKCLASPTIRWLRNIVRRSGRGSSRGLQRSNLRPDNPQSASRTSELENRNRT